MNKNIKYILIAFLVFSILFCVIFMTCFKSPDVSAVYTRNNLSWSNAEFSENGSVKLNIKSGKTTFQLKNDVKGNIGYNIYVYAEEEISNEVELTAKGMTEIDESEYPASLKEYDIKCAYRGYLDGNGKKNFTLKSDISADLRLLVIIEDNNSYPKEDENIPTIANVKFRAEVLLDGQYAKGKAYSFSLKDSQGEIIETVHNSDRYISFSNIALKQKGTYIYYLSQDEGKDRKTDYDESVYKITVVAEEGNSVKVSYEKDGTPKETLPRFSNYKESKSISNPNSTAEYPNSEETEGGQTNYLLIITLVITFLLILFYIIMGRKKW